jgi:hypothetical protein
VPKYETDTLLTADRIWHSTLDYVAQKRLTFLQIEAVIFDAQRASRLVWQPNADGRRVWGSAPRLSLRRLRVD